MIKNSLAPQFAKVLFQLDTKKKQDPQKRLLDFASLLEILQKNPKLNLFFKAPQIDVAKKEALLHSLLEGVFDKTFLNFLHYLVLKRKMDELPRIAQEYRKWMNKEMGIWQAEIVTAIPLEGQLLDKIKIHLEKKVNKKIELTKKINPKIIGGALLMIGNEMIDWSVATRLKKMKEFMLA